MGDMRRKFPGLTDGYAAVMAAAIDGFAPIYHMSKPSKSAVAAQFHNIEDIASFIMDMELNIDSALRYKRKELILRKHNRKFLTRSIEVKTRAKMVADLARTYKKHTGRRAGYSFSYRTGKPSGPFVELLVLIYQDIKLYKSRETIKLDIKRSRTGV